MPQDKLTRQQVVGAARRLAPDYYKDWGDDQIYRTLLRDRPELRGEVEQLTTGERLYKEFGSSEAAGFWKRFGFQFESQMEGMKAGLVGLAPWNEAEAGEAARGYAMEVYKNKVAGDTELQAYLAWKEDEPGWTDMHTFSRSLSEALPSLAIATTSLIAAPFTEGGSLAAGALALAPIGIMEGTNMYNEMMGTLVDEVGLDPEEARGYANIGTAIYTPFSVLLERIGVKAWGRTVGIGDDTANAIFRKKMAEALVRWGVDEKRLAKMGARTIIGGSNFVQNALIEGSTEGMQAFGQNAITRGFELGLGETQADIVEAIDQSFKDTWQNPAVWEEGFAGATTGVLGIGGAFKPGAVSVEKQQQILDDIAMKKEAELYGDEDIEVEEDESPLPDTPVDTPVDAPVEPVVGSEEVEPIESLGVKELKKMATDLKIKGRSKLNTQASLVKAIKNAQKEQKRKDSDLESRFLDAIIETDDMQDVLDDASLLQVDKETPDNKKSKSKSDSILKANSLANIGDKILSLVLDNPKIIDKIEKSKNSDSILSYVRGALNQAIDNSENKDFRDSYSVKDTKSGVLAALRSFAKRGIAEDIVSEQGDIDEASMGITFRFEPEEIVQPSEPTGDIETTGAPEVAGTPVEGVEKVETVGTTVVKKDATAPSQVNVGDRGVMSAETRDLDSSKVPKGMKRAVAVLKKSKNAFEIQEIKKESYVLKEVDPISSEATGKSIEVPKVVGAMPIMSLIKGDSGASTAADIEESQRIIAPGQGVSDGQTKTPSKDKPVVVKKVTKVGEEGDLQPGMSVDINRDLVGKAKLNKDLKNKMNKISQGGYEVLSVHSKSYRVKNTETNETFYIPKALFSGTGKGSAKIASIVAAKAPKYEDVVEIDKDSMAAREEALSDKKVLVKDLKKILDDKKLSKAGVKADLIKRIVESEFDTTTGKPLESKPQTKKEEAPTKKVAGTKVDEVRLRYDEKKKQYYVSIGGKREDVTPAELKRLKDLEKRNKKLGKKAPESVQEAYDKDKADLIADIITRVKGVAKSKPVVKRKDTKEEDFRADADTESRKKEMGFDFQDDKSSDEILISEDKVLANKILSRLKKHFPFVDVKTFTETLNIYGKERIGFALERLVAWSTTDGRMDTMPHEYAHIYIKLMRNDPLVKKAIEKFGGEEQLVKYIGLYYVKRMRNTKLIPRIKLFLKQFANRMRRFFGKDVKGLESFIAEEFYQGRFLGYEAVVGDQFIDFMNKDEDEETSGEEISPDFTNAPSDHHMTQIFHKTLGIYFDKVEHYPKLIDIAKKSKTLDAYIKNLYDFALKTATKRGSVINGKLDIENLKDIRAKDKNGQYKIIKENPNAWVDLNMAWVKSVSIIGRFDPDNKNKQGRDTRLNFQYVIPGNKPATKGDGITVAGNKSRINGKKYSSNNIMNFFEEQQLREGSNVRLAILPIKEISRTNVNSKTKQAFWKSASFAFDKGQIFTLQRKFGTQYLAQMRLKLSEDNYGTESNPLKTIAEEGWMFSFLGGKLGDNSAGVMSRVFKDDNPLNITPESYMAFFKREKANGNINENHFKELTEDIEKLTVNKNPLVNSTISEYIDKRISEKAKRSEIVGEIDKFIDNAVMNKYEMSQALARYKAWQEIRVPNYLIHEKSVADTMTRLSIDLAEGSVVRGLGKSKLMVIPKKAKVSVKDENGEWVEAGTYDDFDGATFTAGKWFNRVGKILGANKNKLTQLKTFVRQRDVDSKDPNKVDYIGMKHMQFTPFKDMRFYDPKTGEMVAEVVGKGVGTTEFVDANGNAFDMIASKNEAKMMYGKYNDSDYQVHELNEQSVKVVQIQRTTKNSASHPIALGEMILSSYNDEGAKGVIKAIKNRYQEVINHYNNEISSLYGDSSNFVKFLKRETGEGGKLPMELDEYLEMLKEDGTGIWVSAIRSHLTPILNNRLIRNGLFKARAWGGKSSKVYLKPAVHLKINEGSVMISSQNRVAYRQVEEAYKKHNNIKGSMIKYWEGLGYTPQDDHLRIVKLNEFLENNEVNVLIHRNPIQKTGGVVLRRVQRLHEGGHGQNIFLSWSDVKNVLDGDWDGDTAAFEFISDEYSNALKKWQKSDAFKEASRVVSINPFGSRVDKAEEQTTSLSNFDNVADSIAENAKLDGATGSFVNAKTIMSQLYYKGFKLYHDSLQESKGWIEVAPPDSRVLMDYAALEEDNLTPEEIQIIKDNGDKIVEKDGKKYLETTKAHEISILFQMAVDSGKYDVFGKILDKSKLSPFEFMLSKIFQTNNPNKEVNKIPLFTQKQANNRSSKDPISTMMGMLQLVYSAQNISQMRQGKNLNSEARRVASYDTNISQSHDLHGRFYNEKGKQRTASDYSKQFQKAMFTKKEDSIYDSRKHGSLYGKSLTMKNNITPAEELMMGLTKIYKNDFYQLTNSQDAIKTAHVRAIDRLVEGASDLPMWGDFVSGKKTSDYIAHWEFLNKPQEFNGESTSFLEQWNNLKADTAKNTNIQTDLNDQFTKFVDRHIEQWQKLSEPAQIWATIKYLSGTKMEDVHVTKLPPLALMNKKVVARYIRLFEIALREQVNDNGKAADAKTSREETEAYTTIRRVNKTYKSKESVDKAMKVCRE